MLLIAPTAPPQAIDFAPPFHTPLAVILPACDGDASFLEGQHYVEAARLYPDRRAPAVAYFLPGANHNFFNAAVAADDGRNGFSRCSEATPRIDRAAQEAFLAGLTPDLLAAWESGDVGAIPALDLAAPIPDALYGAPALTSPFPPAPQRRAILPGTSSDELALSPLGGAVAATGATLDFCPYGMVGSGSPCREGVSVPGTPAMLHLAWEAPGAAVTIAVPPAYADATAAAALQLRLAVDPLDPRSAAGTAQELRVVLRDAAGAEASQPVSVAFPSGQALRDAWFGHVFLGAARLPLGLFPGVDLARLAAVELRPAREAGAIFLADLELVSGGEAIAGPPPPSRYRSLAVRAVAPSLGVIPPGSTLFVRLFEAGAEGEALRFLTIQSGPVGGADVAPFTVRYHRAAVDGRVEYVIEADLQTPAGESLAARPPVPAIVRGVAFGPFELSLAPVVVAEPTPIPTDATFRLTMIAPPGRPFPPGALINVTLSRLDAQGDGVETIVGVSRILEGAPAESVLVELPYMSGRVLAGEPYGVSVDVFAADGIARLTAPGPTTIVDLAAGEAEVRLEAATP